MANYQTTANANEFIIGSCKIEVGEDVGSLVELGAANGVKLTESWENIELVFDNAPKRVYGIKNQQVLAEATLKQINMTNLALIRGGIDVLTNVAGVLVSGASQVVASGGWAYSTFIPIEHQNYDGSAITINSVTGSVDGALVLDTDYFVMIDSNGIRGIYIIDSATVTTLVQTITINYDYTPLASRTFTSGGLTSISSRVVRYTHTDENGKKFQCTVFSAKNTQGMTMEFIADDADDVMGIPFQMTGEVDTTRAAGAQLFEIVDERVY